ncbi:MAG: hypothetical protein ACTFAK_12255 [Candidatus Electronema sp. VV]
MLEVNFPGNWASWNHGIGALFLFLFLFRFLYAYKAVALTSFYQIYYFIGMLLSAAIITSGTYMIEIDQQGDYNGIYWVLIIFFCAGIEMNRLGFKIGLNKVTQSVRIFSWLFFKKIVLFFIIITIVLSIYILFSYKGPILLGIDRVTFWRTVVPNYLNFTVTLVIQSGFFVALYYMWEKRINRNGLIRSAVLITYIFIIIVVLGQKFSAFIILLNAWLALAVGIYPALKIKIKYVFLSLGIFLLISSIVIITYLNTGNEVSFIITRIALQAQLLWSVFNDSNSMNLLSGDWYCYFGCDNFKNGQDYISYHYLPIAMYNFYSEKGVVLSGFMPALSIMTFGVIGSFALHLVISFFLGILQGSFVSAIKNANFLYGFLLFKFYFGIVIMWYVGTNTPTAGVLLVFILIILYHLIFFQKNNLNLTYNNSSKV